MWVLNDTPNEKPLSNFQDCYAFGAFKANRLYIRRSSASAESTSKKAAEASGGHLNPKRWRFRDNKLSLFERTRKSCGALMEPRRWSQTWRQAKSGLVETYKDFEILTTVRSGLFRGVGRAHEVSYQHEHACQTRRASDHYWLHRTEVMSLTRSPLSDRWQLHCPWRSPLAEPWKVHSGLSFRPHDPLPSTPDLGLVLYRKASGSSRTFRDSAA